MDDRLARFPIIIVLLGMLGACSFQFLYNQLDVLIPAYIDDAVTLDERLEAEVEQRTGVLLRWHRRSQLPEYAAWLDKVQAQLGPELTEQDVLILMQDMDRFWAAIAVAINQELAELLPLLNKAQHDELREHFKDKNQAFREKYIEPDHRERVAGYQQRLTKHIERWVGDLTETQERWAEQAAARLAHTAKQRLARRESWQHGVLQILSSEAEQREKTERLKRFLSDFVELDSGGLKEPSLKNRKIIAGLIAQLARDLEASQSEYFSYKTNEYRHIFMRLSEEG